jgi:hypothetical protein
MAKKQKKDYIPSIYNYCDRWCERCTFSERCAVYEGNMRNKMLSPEQFEKIVTKSFKKALNVLLELAEQQGLDLDNLTKENLPPKDEDREQRVKTFIKKTTTYIINANNWFKEKHAIFKEEESSLIARIEMEIPIDEEAILQLNDAIEIIHWYKILINNKIYRAIQKTPFLAESEEDNTLIINSLQSDENGSAKAALIAIERSITAWESVRSYFPQFTDDILDLFLFLNDIRRELLVWHPQANEFVRPGFDEGWEIVWTQKK